ncbi:MAG: heat-inducible transcriptional repressor HrcA [Candidatus Ratteibacteria bacterium]|nr:heat-inducible transcriptional repressor HrcA [Candidatus Ratteibacteria bacterium]
MSEGILTARRKNILNAVVESYIGSARPVGSRALVQRCQYNLSPATIRNEMAELESRGYITQPHTSAGRIPTDKGYRFYVDHLLKIEKIDKFFLSRLNREYRSRRRTLEEIIRETSKALASVTHHTAVVLAPQFVKGSPSRVELVATGGKRFLMLLVSNFGLVEDKFIQVEEQISGKELRKLNELLNNQDREALKESLLGLKKESKEGFSRLYRKAQRVLREIHNEKDRKKVYMDGTSFFLDEPEFKDGEKIGVLLRSLEQEETFERIFKSTAGDEIKVLIGRECGCKEMKECSVVFASYRLGEKPIGKVGVIGPKRMDYRQAVTLVSSTAKRLSSIFNHLDGVGKEGVHQV